MIGSFPARPYSSIWSKKKHLDLKTSCNGRSLWTKSSWQTAINDFLHYLNLQNNQPLHLPKRVRPAFDLSPRSHPTNKQEININGSPSQVKLKSLNPWHQPSTSLGKHHQFVAARYSAHSLDEFHVEFSPHAGREIFSFELTDDCENVQGFTWLTLNIVTRLSPIRKTSITVPTSAKYLLYCVASQTMLYVYIYICHHHIQCMQLSISHRWHLKHHQFCPSTSCTCRCSCDSWVSLRRFALGSWQLRTQDPQDTEGTCGVEGATMTIPCSKSHRYHPVSWIHYMNWSY